MTSRNTGTSQLYSPVIHRMTPIRVPSNLSSITYLAASLLALPLTLHAQQPGVQGLVEQEIAWRKNVSENFAADMMAKGAEALKNRDYESAYAYYKSAVDAIPDSPATAKSYAAALEGFSQACVKLTEQRISEGRFEDARNTIAVILQDKYNPNYGPALRLERQLKDKDYYNQTLTPGFIGRVEEVKQLLIEADGYYQSGRFDMAFKRYEQVLNLDPYNIAARRGMEKVNNARASYANTAYNQSRAQMITDVDRAWELPVKKYGGETSTIIEQPTIDVRSTDSINRKLDTIIIPSVSFRDTTIREAVDFIKQRSIALDTSESDSSRKGINIVLKLDPSQGGETGTRITLGLTNVPLRTALEYIAQAANLKIKVEPYAVAIVPLNEPTDILITKEYRVQPDFITNVPSAGGELSAEGVAAARTSAREFLEAQGVTFPPGATANYLPSSSKLIVRNTQENLDLIDNLVEISNNTPKQIEIESKFIEITQNNLQELGFDWLIGQFAMPFGSGVYGSGGSVGNQANFQEGYPMVAPNGTPIGMNANGTGQITAGNRSGTAAIRANALDALLFATPAGPAPGILAVAGVFTNPQFQVVVRALNQMKGVDLMSAPKVTTKSGQTATIEIVREFLYPTEFDPPQIPQTTGLGLNPVTPSTPSQFEKKDLGVILQVEPTLGPDNYTIDLILSPRVVEFEGFINYGSPINTFIPFTSPVNPVQQLSAPVTLTENVINQPVFSVREVTTQVSAYDGATVALGGLMREDIQKVEDKTPILGDIPLVGRLFRTSASQHLKRNLIIFVTTRVIDPAGQPLTQEVVDGDEIDVPDAAAIESEIIPGDALSVPMQ